MQFLVKEKGKIVQKSMYTKAILLNSDDIKIPGHMLQVVTISPGKTVKNHYHKKQTEIYYILQGTAKIIINNQRFQPSMGDSFVIEPGEVHGVENLSNIDFKIVVFKINLPKNNEDIVWSE